MGASRRRHASGMIGPTLRFLALTAALLAVAAAPASAVRQPRRPAAVKHWIGNWRTNGHGTVLIYDVNYAPTYKSVTKCPCNWYAVGRWNGAGIGIAFNSDLIAASGGWEYTRGRFGLVRMMRRGDRWTGFF